MTMTALPYGKVNARSTDANSITNLWQSRTPFKGNSVTGIKGAHWDTGRLPKSFAFQYDMDRKNDRIVYTVLSYGTPIAWVLNDGTEVKPAVKYSVTTSKHQGKIY